MKTVPSQIEIKTPDRFGRLEKRDGGDGRALCYCPERIFLPERSFHMKGLAKVRPGWPEGLYWRSGKNLLNRLRKSCNPLELQGHETCPGASCNSGNTL